ncbi:MAG: DegV family protein, partial [Acidimicrobiales bacterium]
MIALVTDSSTQVPVSLCERYGIHVVPITVVVDGHPYQEGVDLDPDVFLERLRAGATVSTAAPSPGQIAEVYREVAAAGATQIVSVHAGAGLSAVLSAAG